MPARSTAALIATAPRSLAASEAKSPCRPPMGVRAAPTITTGSLSISLGLVEQFASDQHPPDLARAGADLVQLRVAPQPPGGKLVDVAVAAQRLDRLARHPRRLFRRVENGAGRVL